MTGSCFKLQRLLLPLGSMFFCVSLMATPLPQYQNTQQPAPDNTKKKQGSRKSYRRSTENESRRPCYHTENPEGRS
jgi:hypothetical protein